MHVASAVGTAVVAVFGATDPAVTGPLGVATCVLQQSALRSRDVPRDSVAARKSLALVEPAQVYEAAREMLNERPAAVPRGQD
jgi:ADP-heptose:LPS heptosyltransferase